MYAVSLVEDHAACKSTERAKRVSLHARGGPPPKPSGNCHNSQARQWLADLEHRISTVRPQEGSNRSLRRSAPIVPLWDCGLRSCFKVNQPHVTIRAALASASQLTSSLPRRIIA